MSIPVTMHHATSQYTIKKPNQKPQQLLPGQEEWSTVTAYTHTVPQKGKDQPQYDQYGKTFKAAELSSGHTEQQVRRTFGFSPDNVKPGQSYFIDARTPKPFRDAKNYNPDIKDVDLLEYNGGSLTPLKHDGTPELLAAKGNHTYVFFSNAAFKKHPEVKHLDDLYDAKAHTIKSKYMKDGARIDIQGEIDDIDPRSKEQIGWSLAKPKK